MRIGELVAVERALDDTERCAVDFTASCRANEERARDAMLR